MEFRFGSMPTWLQRLLLFWGVGALFVVVVFVIFALFHVIILGAVFGLCFFIIQSIYQYFFKNTSKTSKIFTAAENKTAFGPSTEESKDSKGHTYDHDAP